MKVGFPCASTCAGAGGGGEVVDSNLKIVEGCGEDVGGNPVGGDDVELLVKCTCLVIKLQK